MNNRNGVRLTHVPTGIEVGANGHRSQHRNRESAYIRLKSRMCAGIPDMSIVTTYRFPDDEQYPDDLMEHREKA